MTTPGPRHFGRSIDRRGDARIIRGALDEVKAIQTLLADIYKDAGDGRTLVRELVQNADDAGAGRLLFVVVEQGWENAENGLLRGPGLLVVNNGPFPARDRDALHQALGGSKADDTGKVGRFGIGLKSVFHICEAIVYVGAEAGTLRPGALNPWAGTGEQDDADPLHPDWDKVADNDLDMLEKAATGLLGRFDNGLLLWIPLRRRDHLDRARDRPYGLGQFCPTAEEIAGWFNRPATLALLLAQCGYLRSIEAGRAGAPGSLAARTPLARVSRPGFEPSAWVGRYDDDSTVSKRSFEGTIESNAEENAADRWAVQGVEALGHDKLFTLRSSGDWPIDLVPKDGHVAEVPRKALAHAAVTVLRANSSHGNRALRVRWAVFLPLDDAPVPGSNALVETTGSGDKMNGAWDIILHGYFWPSHDRRSIPGVTDDDDGTGDGAMRVRWNRSVRDELLLPLVPAALARETNNLDAGVAWQFLRAVAETRIVRDHLEAVTRRHLLLPTLTESGIRWDKKPSEGMRLLSVPAWTKAPEVVRKSFAAFLSKQPDKVVFIDNDAPRLGGEPGRWPADWLKRLLDCVPAEAFHTPRDLRWIEGLVRHVMGSGDSLDDELVIIVARWIGRRIGEGVLTPTTDGPVDDTRKDLREAWRSLFSAFPKEWLVEAPVDSQHAVVELAAAGLVGEGLLPIPLGRRPGAPPQSRPEPQRLDSALLELGRRLAGPEGTSQRTRRSRLLLAETLLAVREDIPLEEELESLPLLRARRLPDDRDEAWSIGALRRRNARQRVFARPGTDAEDGEDDGSSLEAPSDPKRAVQELSGAISEPVWLVDAAVGAAARAPVPAAGPLASAVLCSEAIRFDPLERQPLLQRLSADLGVLAADDGDTVRNAIRALLTGRVADDAMEGKLYYVRSQDSEQAENQKTLEILLRLLNRPWSMVRPALIESLPHALVEVLLVKAVDAGVLHDLLREALDEPVDWSMLEQSEVLHLLRHLFETTPEKKAAWRAMPLHRGIDGERGPIDGRTFRLAGDLRPPADLAAEIRLLDPDPEAADLYHCIPKLDNDGILRVMLQSEHPWRFADQIIRGLQPDNEGRVTLPRDKELLDLLRQTDWLPDSNSQGGIAPRKILLLPNELETGVSELASSGALGDYRRSNDVLPAVWSAVERIVHEILGRPSRYRQVQKLARALDPDRVARVNNGAFLILPEAQGIDILLIKDALETPLAGSHQGWALLHAATEAVVDTKQSLEEVTTAARDAVVELARSLCAPVPASRQLDMLKTLAASRPAKDSASGRLFGRLVECFARTDGFFEKVLPGIDLPTQDGRWHPSREVARSASGVARRHRLLSDLRASLRLDSDEPVREQAVATKARIGPGTADALAKYFESWSERIPRGAVGAFLGLLGNGKDDAIARLAEDWLGDDVSVEGMRDDLVPEEGSNFWDKVKVFVSGSVARGSRVEAVNVLGERIEMDADSDEDTVFATDPIRCHSRLGAFWDITLRDVEPQRRTAYELIGLLGGTVEWWAVHILRVDLQAVRAWWSRWGTGSQAQVGPVRASILAHLPLTLHQLDVRECPPLWDALRDAQRAQRKREQAPPAQLRDAMKAERSALDRLASLICDDPQHQRFLWERVQDLIQRFGYREDSVLLELAQNADDALAQAAEIAGGELAPAARRFLVRIHEVDGIPTLDITHYGRPINDTGGASFPQGRERQWDQDLYFMMLLNLSGKPGEAPSHSTAASTTGRFGLGFKSVHIVSQNPLVVSGFLAFSIAGGLLPSEQPVPDDPDLLPVEGYRATRVRLPLRGDLDSTDLERKLFQRFMYARTLLPVFARQLREVVVEGGPFPGIARFKEEIITGAPGWAVATETTELPNHERWRIVRFRPPEAKGSTVALMFGLKDGVPAPFPSDLPFLWNVTPTSEGWGCGYAINGPFKLDPGRTHVSLDSEETLAVVNMLGKALGAGLVELHDALETSAGTLAHDLPTTDRLPSFLASLWTVLISGIDSPDDLRQKLLLRLHGPGQGLSVWMSARSVVPSELPAPFPERLPPLKPGTRIEVAVGGLDHPDICKAFADIDEVASLLKRRCVVSCQVAQRLRPLLPGTIPPIQPSDVLSELADAWDHFLSAERLHSLRPFADDAVWRLLTASGQGSGWASQLVALAADGSRVSLRSLLLPRELLLPDERSDIEDELLRAAFAPDSRILDKSYIEAPEDLTVFQRLRARHEIDAATMAAWYPDIPPQRRKAALRYLLHGSLQHEILERLVSLGTRPIWLAEYDEVREMLEDMDEEEWRCRRLLAALFPSQFEDRTGQEPQSPLPHSTRRTFFERMQAWWDNEETRRKVIGIYEARVWPAWLRQTPIADGLRSDSSDHWLALLVLGACQSLGRAQDGHHRTFLERAYDDGWWMVFKTPDDKAAWMDVLRTWQEHAVENLSYSRWMSLFPAIYQLSRYLEKYRRLLRTAGRRPAELYRVSCLLAPRVDEALTGAGQQFDAPPAPLNMGLHWVLRELVRLGVLEGDHLLPDCWVPSEQLLRFLRPLGLHVLDNDASNSEKAKAVFDFLASELKTKTPHLHRAFDIPFRHIDGDPHLKRQLGLED